MTLSRRSFVAATAATAAILGQQSNADGPQPWYNRPMRWAQLTLVEDDPGNYDPAFWLDYFKRTHSDAACLSAGGCVAYYPTQVPLHYRSKWLGNRDSFGELVAGCRKLGMNVVARTDPHAAHQEVYDAHPDWIAVDEKGQKRRHWADSTLWVTCGLGPYNFEFMTAVTSEIMRTYRVDGIFSNRWDGSGMCYCEHCQRNFRAFSGMDLPRSEDPLQPALRQYVVWRQKRLFDLWKIWDSEIKKVNPGAAFIANAGGGALSDLDMKTIGELAPTLFADRQARRGLMPPWTNGKNGKEYAATLGNKAIAGIFSMGVEEPYRWKDSVQSADEIRLWVVDGVAHNLRPWFTKFNGKVIDKRWIKVVEDLYTWHHRHEKYLRNERSLARVGLVYSQQTATFYGGPRARTKVEDHALGWYQALIEGRVPFDMVHDQLLDRTSPYRTLILPNIAALSDAQCAQLKAFVDRGGNLIATHETSLYDEWGVRRKDFGLASLFGASYAGSVDARVQNSYLNIEKPYHALVRGLEDASRIINGTSWVNVKPTASTDLVMPPPLTLVPSYPDLPMEQVFPRIARTTTPGVFLRAGAANGKGRVVYFPSDIDRTFWEVLSADHGTLLRNALAWAHNSEPQPLSVEGKGVLDVSLWQQKDSIAAHLVNLTNPMMMKGPVREIIPSPPQKVRIHLLPGRKAMKTQFLVRGGNANPRTQPDGSLVIDVPSIDLHEVIAVDLAPAP